MKPFLSFGTEASLPSGRVLNIGYDDSRGNVCVVFVVNHGT